MSALPKIPLLLAALGPLLLGSCGGTYEEITYEASLRGEAGINPLLASELTLGQLGLPASSSSILPSELPADTVVLLNGERLRSEGPVLEKVLAWADAGGHAMVFLDGFTYPLPLAHGPSEVPFALLDRLGVKRVESDVYRDYEEFNDEEEELEPVATEVDKLSLDLFPEAGWLVEGDDEWDAAPFLRIDYGTGRFTLVPEGNFIARKNLGDSDHAQWLWEEVYAGSRRPSSALLIHGGRPTLWTMILKHTPQAPWILLGLVVLTLWRMAARFGPRLQEAPHARLGFDRHIASVGAFLWRRGGSMALVKAWRKRVARAATQTLHLKADATGDITRSQGFAERLSERSGMPESHVRTALTSSHVEKPNSFTQVVADLQALEKSL